MQGFILIFLMILVSNNIVFAMQNKFDFDIGQLNIIKDLSLKGLSPLVIKIVNLFEDPIAFGKTNTQNYKAIKELGQHNLIEVYQNQNPNLLFDHYVPIIFVDIKLIDIEESFDAHIIYDYHGNFDIVYAHVINPYGKSFYTKLEQPGVCKKLAAIKKVIEAH